MKTFSFKSILIISTIFVLLSCNEQLKKEEHNVTFVDKNLSKNTQELYERLANISKHGIAIGHQDDTSYGLGWKHEAISNINSDVKKVTGDFPAVFGFDIGWIEIDSSYNLDTVPFNHMKDLIIDAHKKGGIITISWHANNPVSEGSSWDKTVAVPSILKGGDKRELYELWVKRVAVFLDALEVNNEKIPVVFRPFHEMNGSWFWWGGENCKPEDYVKLWQETVELLRDTHNIHHLLYAYSPNLLNTPNEYLKYYPGDAYADILGIDIYDFNNSENYINSVVHDLKILQKTAEEKNKIYAFTETGLESVKTENWYTEVLYPSIKNSGIAWVLTWRNYDTKHHYMPYKGHINEDDFIKFKEIPEILFLNDINELN